MDAIFDALGSTTLNAAHLLAGAVLAVVLVAVWRRSNLKLPGGIQIGDDAATKTKTLQSVLEEQRRAYDHLTTRVQTLEDRVADLERKLAEARQRERDLEAELESERQAAGERIAHLEAELAVAEARIAHLEDELAAALARLS